MPLSHEEFLKQLEESGILESGSFDTLRDVTSPDALPKDADALARELVRQKRLTEFQAEQACLGNASSLVLGNYVLMEKIGQGGMGQVFKAHHRRMKRVVAVKLLPAALTKDADAIARFEREVEVAAKIIHPNIVAAYDADCASGVHFLVMEYVEGSDLSALVRKNGPLSVENTINYVLQAARGLESAHKKGIVHRDIKPANLLLDTQGTVKVLDMGLARLSADGDGPIRSDLTNTDTIMGTADYIAPEQAMNTKNADNRADIYSLGITLYYLLAGKPAYSGDSIMEKLMAHREQPIPSLRTICSEVPEKLESIFRKMAAKKVSDRYQTMTDLIADLEQCGQIKVQTEVIHEREARADQKHTNFLQEISSAPKRPPKTVTQPQFNNGRKLALIVAAVMGMAMLAVIVVSLKTKDGTLVVEVDQPDVTVQVLDAAGKVEVSKKDETGTISISVDPGKHRLKIEKDGFEFFSENFEMKSGGKQTITAKLILTENGKARAATTWQGWPANAPKPAIAPFDAAQSRKHQEAWAKYLQIEVEYTNTLGMKFMLIPPGEFTMGSTPEEIEEALKDVAPDVKHRQEYIKSEAPLHKVILTHPIYLGVTEVTQAEYEKVMGSNPSQFAPTGMAKEAVAGRDTADNPVENVSWNDAAEFCAKLSKQEKLKSFYLLDGETITPLEGTGYRLPSNAEWEFACRAGTITKYWIGDKDEDLVSVGWFGGNSGGRTHAVGELKSNPFGLADTHGNVWEWVQDGWDATWYAQFQEKPAINPTSPFVAGSQRVIRGGDWLHTVSYCRSSNRLADDPTHRYGGLGFRLSLAVSSRVSRP